MADVTVKVYFDPCALDSHEWRPITQGIATIVSAEECTKCWETRIPDYVGVGGIDRTDCPSWKGRGA